MAPTPTRPINWFARYRALLVGTKDAEKRANAASAQASLAKEILAIDGEAARLADKAAAGIRRVVEATENRLLKKAILQPALFLDDLWIDCGKNERILLGDMNLDRWQRRKDLISTNFGAVASAFGNEVAFIDDQRRQLSTKGPNAFTRNLYP